MLIPLTPQGEENRVLDLPVQNSSFRRQLGGNANQLKQMNLRTLVQLLREHKALSRAELARRTRLNTSTISDQVTQLIEAGIVRESGRAVVGSVGRRAELLELVPEARFALGVYIGDIDCLGLITDLSGRTHASFRVQVPSPDDPGSVASLAIAQARAMLAGWDGPRDRLLGVGLGLPGLVDAETGIAHFLPHLGWENVRVRELWQEAFDLAVFVDNDIRALALGEQWFGLGQSAQSLACLHVGDGIGCGVVIGGRIYHGATGGGGEIGHTVVDMNGPLCRCGSYGCLQTLAGGQAVITHVARGLLGAVPSSLSAATQSDPRRLTLPLIFDAARHGDQLAQHAVEQTIPYAGVAVASVINIFNPQLVVLSGEVFEEGTDLIVDPVIEHARKRILGNAAKLTPICTTGLGKYGPALGAACLVLQQWLAGSSDLRYVRSSL
jgi:N-acetylglucosamine repressor